MSETCMFYPKGENSPCGKVAEWCRPVEMKDGGEFVFWFCYEHWKLIQDALNEGITRHFI